MGIWVIYAKPGLPKTLKTIVVTEPTQEFSAQVGHKTTTVQGIKIPTEGGVQYPFTEEQANLAKKNPNLIVKYLEHLEADAPAKVVNAAIGGDLDQVQKKMAKPEVENDSKEAREKAETEEHRGGKRK